MNFIIIMYVAGLVIIGIMIFYVYKKTRNFKKLEREVFAAMDEECIIRNLFDELVLWKVSNLGNNWSDPEAQKIIKRHIRKIRILKDTYPEIDFEKRIVMLNRLLE